MLKLSITVILGDKNGSGIGKEASSISHGTWNACERLCILLRGQ
jgi:hypothetical protein